MAPISRSSSIIDFRETFWLIMIGLSMISAIAWTTIVCVCCRRKRKDEREEKIPFPTINRDKHLEGSDIELDSRKSLLGGEHSLRKHAADTTSIIRTSRKLRTTKNVTAPKTKQEIALTPRKRFDDEVSRQHPGYYTIGSDFGDPFAPSVSRGSSKSGQDAQTARNGQSFSRRKAPPTIRPQKRRPTRRIEPRKEAPPEEDNTLSGGVDAGSELDSALMKSAKKLPSRKSPKSAASPPINVKKGTVAEENILPAIASPQPTSPPDKKNISPK